MKYWEIIADNLSEAGCSWGCVSMLDSDGRAIFVADAHHDDGQRFIVRADEKLRHLLNLNQLRIQPAKLVKRDSSQFRSNSLGGNRHKNRN